MTTRRHFLAGLTSAVAAPGLGWAAVGNPVALSAAQTAEGRNLLLGLAAGGEITFRVPLPARGHAAAAHPHLAEAVAIARRPGTFAKVIDCTSGAVLKILTAPAGRHFYGHGAFSADGALLFTTENAFETGEGRIGVWDKKLNYQRIDEFSSGGIGPHEILRLPSGALAVANGGIRTHPKTGRKKLNLESMRGNVSLFSTAGTLLDCGEAPDSMRLNSPRHIASAPGGTLICGYQWQGDPHDAPQLVAFYDGRGTLWEGDLDTRILRRLDGYIGSVCAISDARFAVSSPRGGRVVTLDATGTQQQAHRALDVCGISVLSGSSALVTDGYGHVYRLQAQGLEKLRKHPLAFDNHLVALA
ncbi:MAG: DUF1513 domain-containing protein [Roseobacter sp.]